MKKCNFLFILLCSLASSMVEASNPAVQKRIDTSIHKTSFEITYEEGSFDRFKKALFHYKDLLIAEQKQKIADDPFAN